MSRFVVSLSVGAAAGCLAGALLTWSDLSRALDVTLREEWWGQGMMRLTALEWHAPLRALALWCLGGAAAGALLGGRSAAGGRSPESRPASSPGTGFAKRLTAFAGGLLLVAVCGAEVARTVLANRPACDGPNIVWIVLDALRADHLGCYGYHHDTSPFLDRLAERSTRFDFALSQESYTLASAASYFTSTYPPVHGVMYDEPRIDLLADGMLTVAEVLRDRGYATAAFVFNPHLQARYRFGQGFEVYDDSVSKPPSDTDPHVHEIFDTAERMHAKVKDHLEQRSATGDTRPAALYLHYRDIHGPYVPPPPYHDMFAPSDWTDAQRSFALQGTCRPQSQPPAPFVEDLGYRFAQYDGEIRYTDDALARLFELLAEHDIDLTNTVVVVTADHGEEFRDVHPDDIQGWTHGRTLYVEQVRVPLIVSLPDATPGGGRVVNAPVELLDLGPTLVELTGCDDAPMPDEFQGRSLLPLLEGGSRTSRPVFSGGNHGRGLVLADGLAYYTFDENTKSKERRHSARPDDSYVGRRGEQLFDMRSDPHQTEDVLSGRWEHGRRLAALLDQWLQVDGLRNPSDTADVDAETAEQLRALGYLGGTDSDPTSRPRDPSEAQPADQH